MKQIVARDRAAAFTLVELLVVIGIIAILISVLLPVLGSARKASEKAKCLASLHQIGDAYKMYAADNKGSWPVSVHFYPGGTINGVSAPHRDKRYHDFIAKYLMGNQAVTDPATGKQYSDNNMNFNGTCSSDTLGGVANYATHGPFGTAADPIWMGTLQNKSSVLWGCPSWSQYGQIGTSSQYQFGINNGYAMNYYAQAPLDEGTGAGTANGVILKKCARVLDDTWAGTLFPGNYLKATQFTRQAERVLIYESTFNAGYQAPAAWNTGTGAVTVNGASYDPTDNSAILPPIGDQYVSIDWNRHTKAKPGKVRNTDPALNVLYCDGHAGTVSARECYRGIRFH
jgi:prepilin-type processing-associated H-X9-DG protein